MLAEIDKSMIPIYTIPVELKGEQELRVMSLFREIYENAECWVECWTWDRGRVFAFPDK